MSKSSSVFKKKVALLVASTFIASTAFMNAAFADSITLTGSDNLVWDSATGITSGGVSSSKLSEITSSASVPAAVSTAATVVQTAITTYATTSNDANKQALNGAIIAYNAAVATAQGSVGAGNGIPTIHFNDDTTLTATSGTADQRLVVGAGQALALNVADGKTLTISGNYIDVRTVKGPAISNSGTLIIGDNVTFSENAYGGGAGVLMEDGVVHNSGGTLVIGDNVKFLNNEKTGYLGGSVGISNVNDGVVVVGDGALFSGNSSNNTAAAIFNYVGTFLIGNNAVFTNNSALNTSIIANLGGVLVVGDNLQFYDNQEGTSGIYLNGFFQPSSMIVGDNAKITNNSADADGQISVTPQSSLKFGKNAFFSGNTAADGSAVNLGGSITEVYPEFLLGSGAIFSNNIAQKNGGAVYVEFSNFNLQTSADVRATQFFGNTDSSGANSIYFDSGTLNVSGDGKLDMLDPMLKGANANAVAINQSGGTWYLAGTNDFSQTGADNTTFSITGGELYLYGAGEDSKTGATDDNGIVKSTLGVINIGGANSSFTLGSGATLTSGGMGNAIDATNGSIALENNASLGFNLANHDGSNASMLTLNANAITVGNNLNVVLTSMANATGDYNLLHVSQDGVLVNDNITLMAAGQVINDVDFLQYAKGRVESNDYIVTIGGYTWNSALNNLEGQSLAHGNFTVASGDFTVDTAFADRSDITASANAFGWDGTTLNKKGNGTLILNGVNTYTGLTTVEAGKLLVGDAQASSAQISGDVNVASGATLGGYGTILGQVDLRSGSTLSPGASTGTLTVGGVTFGSGSTYLYEVNSDGTSDQLVVTSANGGSGVATIENGANLTINTLGAGKFQADKTYTVITADSGVTGQFSNVVNNLAFLDYAVVYNANSVELQVSRNDETFQSVGGSKNQQNIGSAIDSLPTTNAVYKAVVSMNAEQARNAYDNLSGEIYGSSRSVLMMNSHYLRDAMNRRMLSQSRLPSNEPVWFSAWGHSGNFDGNSNALSVDNKGWGMALGIDGAVNDNVFAGIVLGYDRTQVEGARSSSATVDAFQVGGYVATEINTIKLRGGLAYSYLNSEIERSIWVDGLQSKATSNPDGWQFQVFGEASKDFKLFDKVTLSPYANLAHVWLNFDDTTESNSLAALQIDNGTDSTTFTTLGVRGEVKLPTKTNVSLYGDLGWQHAFGDTDGKTKNRFKNAGRSFSIKGIAIDEDVALIGAGLNVVINDKNTITLGYQGQIGSDVSDHSGNVMWKVKF